LFAPVTTATVSLFHHLLMNKTLRNSASVRPADQQQKHSQKCSENFREHRALYYYLSCFTHRYIPTKLWSDVDFIIIYKRKQFNGISKSDIDLQ
jgi:hypothetical protein